MKGILIDPFTKTVRAVEVNYKDEGILAIYKAIDAGTFDIVVFGDHNDALYVDDDGLTKGHTHYFTIKNFPHPIAGKALLLGTDEAGDSQDVVMTEDAVRSVIGWKRQRFVGFKDHVEEVEIFGKPGHRLVRESIFEPVKDDETRH